MRACVMVLSILMGALAGCADNKPHVVDTLEVIAPTSGGPAAETQAREADQIRQQYDACIRKYDDKNAACEELRWMYEDAKTRYDVERLKKPAQ